MTTKKAEETAEATPVVKTASEKKDEPTYTVDEFAHAAKRLFGKSPDIVRAAFAYAGVDEATKEGAEKLVKAFAERKVK